MSKKAPPPPPKRPSRAAAPRTAEQPPIGTSEHMTPAALPQDFTTGKRVFMQLGLICPDPNNPRRFQDDAKFKELCASVKAEGVLQNIVVRPVMAIRPGDAPYMIICGERRWRAAQVAELPGIDVLIRDVNDQEALSIGLVENVDREDMSPIDEGLGYKRLVEEFRQSVEEVAARVGKSTSYIRRRILVANLQPEALDLVREQRLTMGGAEELARAPKAVQSEFLQTMADRAQRWNAHEVEGAVEVRRFVREKMNVARLIDAPFSLTDGALHGGACEQCPKNTAQQRDLFDEKSGPGECLDRPCFEIKQTRHWAARADAARASGAQVLDVEESRKYINVGGSGLPYRGPLIDLSEDCEEDPKFVKARDEFDQFDPDEANGKDQPSEPKARTYMELLKDHLATRPEEVMVVTMPPEVPLLSQGLRYCVRRERLADLLHDAGYPEIAEEARKEMENRGVQPGLGTLESPGSAADRHKADLERRALEQKAHTKALERAMVKLGDFFDGLSFELPKAQEEQLAGVLCELVHLRWTRQRSGAALRRQLGEDAPRHEWQEKKIKTDPRLEDYSSKDLLGFLVELLMENEASSVGTVTPRVKRALNALNTVDYDALVAEETKVLRAKAKEKAAKASLTKKTKGSKAAS